MTRRKRKSGHLPPGIPDVLSPLHQLRVMGRLIRRRATTPGTAPGTLVRPGPATVEPARITLIEYGPDALHEREPASLADVPGFAETAGVHWLNVDGVHDLDLVRALGERYALHPLVLEDVVSLGQRPKLEEYEGYLYIVLPMLTVDPETAMVRDEQLSLLLGPNWVVTFQERPGDDFGPVRERVRITGARIRGRGADYLAYALVDAVVDHYFAVLEAIGDVAERLEGEVVDRPGRDTMHRLHLLKREMLMVRRAVWPVRDLVNTLMRTESPLVTPGTHPYLRDVYDHAIRIIDTVEVLRDVVGGIMELYLTSLSNRTNEVMKTLTVMASIFIPLTFIVGIYGMNFDYMPELAWPWAYPALLSFMLAVALGMLWAFRRRGWV
jgi:magnesium transporter